MFACDWQTREGQLGFFADGGWGYTFPITEAGVTPLSIQPTLPALTHADLVMYQRRHSGASLHVSSVKPRTAQLLLVERDSISILSSATALGHLTVRESAPLYETRSPK